VLLRLAAVATTWKKAPSDYVAGLTPLQRIWLDEAAAYVLSQQDESTEDGDIL